MAKRKMAASPRTDNELIAELRERMKTQGKLVKIVSFDEPAPTVDELIADLRRLHGVVVKRVRRVQTEEDRLAAKLRRLPSAKEARAKAKGKPLLAAKRGRKGKGCKQAQLPLTAAKP